MRSPEAEQHSRAALDLVADLDLYGEALARRQQDVGARAELDHPEAFPGLQLVAGLEPADDAPGDGPRDLLDAHQPARAGLLQVDPQLLVADGALGVAGVQEGAGQVAQAHDPTGPRR